MYPEAKVALQHLVEPRKRGEGKGTLTRNLSQETGSGGFPTPILHSRSITQLVILYSLGKRLESESRNFLV